MKKMLMTHIVAGYPSMEVSEDLVVLMDECGVDFVEIQIPFSDPVADGPTILAANQNALESGVKVKDCFELMRRLKSRVEVPLLFMTYFNILHHYGVEKFCREAAEAGCWGLIVPDMPMDEEEHEGYLAACKKHGLKAIQVISPLTPESRLGKIAEIAEGFVYCVSRYGTTGTKSDLNPKLSAYLKKVRKYVKVPLAVGFGISSREQLAAVYKEAEIGVIGSAVLRLMEKSEGARKKLRREVGKFLQELR